MQLKGKPLSLGAKIAAAVLAVGGLFAKGWLKLDVPYGDILKAAAFVVLIFSPVDVSLWLENIFQRDRSRSWTREREVDTEAEASKERGL